MKYPKEAPIVESRDNMICAGRHSELVLDENNVARMLCGCFPHSNPGGIRIWEDSDVIPLTPAAEEMMAIAFERSGS